jgi:Fe-S-cluster-containing dehydrogenase component
MAKRYGLVIDLDRCTGCQTCNVACKMEHNLDGFSGIRVDTVGGPHRDTPTGEYPNLSMYYLPIPCMHCSQPPCLPSCPTEAIYQRQDRIVLIDEEKCNGCQQCIEACPYGVLVYDAQKDKAWKCNLCAHRVDQGLEPFCVLCCEMEAIFFGDISDPSAQISKLAEKRKAYVLQPESGAEPAVRYCPPRPRLR